MPKKYLTQCIGTFEEFHPSCHGCSWEKRCKAFTEFLASKKKEIDVFFSFKESSDDELQAFPKLGMVHFRRFCDALLKKKSKRKVRSDKQDRRKRLPSERVRKLRGKSNSATWKRKKEELSKRLEDFGAVLVRRFGGGRGFVSVVEGGVTPVGDFYFSDRMSVSNYVTIYCKSSEGRDVPILSFYFKTASMTFTVHFPCKKKELEKNIPNHILRKFEEFRSIDNGRFKCFVAGVGKSEMTYVAEIAGRLARRGKIKLPKVK